MWFEEKLKNEVIICNEQDVFLTNWRCFVYFNRFLKKFHEKCRISSPFNSLRKSERKTIYYSKNDFCLKDAIFVLKEWSLKGNICLRKLFKVCFKSNSECVFIERKTKSFDFKQNQFFSKPNDQWIFNDFFLI